jgi:hypothetical protein
VAIDLGNGTFVIDSWFYLGLKANPLKVFVPMSRFVPWGFPLGPDFAYDLNMNNCVWSMSVGFFLGGRRGAAK